MLSGIVIHGKHKGKGYGFPTANIKVIQEIKLPPGVYAGYAELDKKKYGAAIALPPQSKIIEVHLLDYVDGDCYGKYLTAEPIQKVSEMERFDSEQELINKISGDIVKVRDVLGITNQ
jgi:riboflavin kinase/FMN adenylyltransferase